MLLIVIEAPKKIDTVRSAARSIWGRDIEVFATGGYVKTFPATSIGIDPLTFEPNADVYTKGGAYYRDCLARSFKEYGLDGPWEKIILLTDPDREGEGIATQALTELRRWFPAAPVERLYAHELTADGLGRAEKRALPHEGMSRAQTARRVLDRLLPLAASQYLQRAGDYRGLGRVQLAAVTVLKKATSDWKRFNLEGRWQTPDGAYHVRTSSDRLSTLQEQLAALKAPGAWQDAPRVVETLSIAPPPAHSAITLMSEMASMRPEDSMSAAQDGYALGRLSYPRTDQTALGEYGRRTVAALVDSLHLGARLSPDWHDASNDRLSGGWVQGAHPGLHPQYGWAPGQTMGDPNRERVENEIAARALGSLMIPATIRRSTVTVEAGQSWCVAVKTEILEPGWTLAFKRLGLENPLAPDMTFGQRIPVLSERVPTPAHAAGWLAKAHLGRPSTLASVPSRMQYLNLLSAQCVPTTVAEQTIAEVSRYMPRLVEPGFTGLMEKGLQHLIDNPSDYGVVVRSLLVEAGGDLTGLPSLISSPQGFDINSALDEAFDIDSM
jgi:DNA topoisomerase IA